MLMAVLLYGVSTKELLLLLAVNCYLRTFRDGWGFLCYVMELELVLFVKGLLLG